MRRPPSPSNTRHTASSYPSRSPAIDIPLPPTPPPPTELPSDGDGIRWELVARMQARIAANTLDTPDRWLIAEELLFAEMDGRR